MKKITIIMVVMSILLLGMVSAAPNVNSKASAFEIKQRIGAEDSAMLGIQGLENALIYVNNTQARNQIRENIQKMNQQQLETIQRLNNQQITQSNDNKTIIVGEARARILGFGVDRDVVMTINEEGELKRKQRVFDFMFQYNEDIKAIPTE